MPVKIPAFWIFSLKGPKSLTVAGVFSHHHPGGSCIFFFFFLLIFLHFSQMKSIKEFKSKIIVLTTVKKENPFLQYMWMLLTGTVMQNWLPLLLVHCMWHLWNFQLENKTLLLHFLLSFPFLFSILVYFFFSPFQYQHAQVTWIPK